MTRLMRFLRAAATIAALPLAGEAAAQGAAAAAVESAPPEERRWLFHVDWGPIKLADVEIRVAERAEGGVELSASGRSVGVAAMLADFEVEQRSTYGPGETRRYRATARWDDRATRREVRWDGPVGAAAPSVELASTDPEPLTPIPAGELEGTVDPAFPVWDVLRKVEAGGSCAGSWRVYDGVRRFDLVMEDQGTEILEADRDWTWGGEALRCRLIFERVGGFPLERRDPARQESDYERLIYVARTEEGAKPVRLRVQWPLGYATARIDLR